MIGRYSTNPEGAASRARSWAAVYDAFDRAFLLLAGPCPPAYHVDQGRHGMRLHQNFKRMKSNPHAFET